MFPGRVGDPTYNVPYQPKESIRFQPRRFPSYAAILYNVLPSELIPIILAARNDPVLPRPEIAKFSTELATNGSRPVPTER